MDAPSRLSRFLRERRSPGPIRRIFFLRQGFFLEEECVRAFRTLGLSVREFTVGQHWDGSQVAALMSGLVESLPDLVFSINHIGFDRQGWLTRFLEEACLPGATWYVDHPDFIIRPYPENVSAAMAVFVWDKHYLPGLEAMGFPLVTYLPLAADTRLFRPFRHPPLERYGGIHAAFVGSTWSQRLRQQLSRYAHDPVTLAYIEEAAREFQWSGRYQARPHLEEIYPGFFNLSVREQVDLEAAVVWQASLWDRAEKVGAMVPWGVKVFGDAAWRALLPDPEAYGGALNHQRDLPGFYQCVAVNLNITSLQMKDGLNQRVFEVPATGAFLLTDYKEALFEIFDPKEVVTYRTLEEARDKLTHYLGYPETRRQVASRTRERILSQHTYVHRVQTILRVVQEAHGLKSRTGPVLSAGSRG
jgi:spore maturation protein CgeB